MQFDTRFFHRLALTGYFGLLCWVIVWHGFLSDALTTRAFALILWVTPLLLPLAGLLRGTPYTYAWSNFVVMIYLLHGLTSIYAVSEQWLYALIELVFATCMFVGCSFFARMRGKELGLGIRKLKEEMADEKAKYEGQ